MKCLNCEKIVTDKNRHFTETGHGLYDDLGNSVDQKLTIQKSSNIFQQGKIPPLADDPDSGD